jgi:HlyD family secretion protein
MVTNEQEFTIMKKKTRWISKTKAFYRTHQVAAWSLTAAVLAAITLATVFGIRKMPSSGQAVMETTALTRGDVTHAIEIVGSVRAVPSTTLAWSTSGVVMPFTGKVGDRFNTGDVILELNPASVPASILQARTDLIDARNELARAQSADSEYQSAAQAVSDAEYTYNQARAYFEAIIEREGATIESVEPLIEDFYEAREELWIAQDIAQSTETLATADQTRIDALAGLDESQRAYNTALDTIMNAGGFYFGSEHGGSAQSTYMTYRSAKAVLNEARADWNAARDNSDTISAAQAKVQALTNTANSVYILAAFDGTVTDIFNFEGDHVSNGTSAIQLDNLATMVVDVNVSEVDINYITVGDTVSITFDALTDRSYNGQVIQVGGAGIDTDGIVKFNVSITLTDSDEAIKPGFTAVSQIIIDQAEDVLMIPLTAIHTMDGQKVVVVQRSGRLTLVPVTLGISSDLYSALAEGDLQAGDLVVVSLPDSTLESLGLK